MVELWLRVLGQENGGSGVFDLGYAASFRPASLFVTTRKDVFNTVVFS